MLDQSAYERLRSSVCSLGYVRASVQPETATVEDEVIVGTGFLIGETTVVTNRHVLKALDEAAPALLHRLNLVYPIARGWGVSPHALVERLPMGGEPDVAMIEFVRSTAPELAQCQPVVGGSIDGIRIGMPIATCGYLLGDQLLKLEHLGITRFGPVLLHGHVAAIAPFDVPIRTATAVITDLRTGGGLSGAPVFVPESGHVIGIHFAGDGSSVWRIGLFFPLGDSRIAFLMRKRSEAVEASSLMEKVREAQRRGINVNNWLMRQRPT